MRRSLHGSLLAVFLAAAAACVEIPANIHAQFSPAGPNDRSNYRPGRHGSAPPVDDADGADRADAGPTAKAAGAIPAAGDTSDAGGPVDPAEAAPAPASDGGVP